jgi:Uma2 family endonuclease
MVTAAPINSPFSHWKGGRRPRLWSPAEFEKMRDLRVFAGYTVELIGGTVYYRDRKDSSLHPFVFTRTEYYLIYDAGLLRNQRVQLIGGVIVREEPMNTPHAVAVTLAQTVLQTLFAAGHHVRVQLPMTLGPEYEPHPDLAVVTGSPRDYLVDHPKKAVLVVEVSDTTLEVDTHDMMSLYAAAGIPEYWVIDTNGRVLVFRDPRPESGQLFGSAYGRLTVHGRDEVIAPFAAPEARIAVNDLLP